MVFEGSKTDNFRFWPEMCGRSKNLIWPSCSSSSDHSFSITWFFFNLEMWEKSAFFYLFPVFRSFPVNRKSSHIDVALRPSIIYDLQKSLGRYLVSSRRSYKISVFSNDKKTRLCSFEIIRFLNICFFAIPQRSDNLSHRKKKRLKILLGPFLRLTLDQVL